MSVSAPPAAISELRKRIARLEGGNARERTVLPFGVAAIDRVLPGGGLAFGGLHEVAGGGNGAVDGAAAALFAAGIAARTVGKVLWCVTRPDLFAPAIEQAGLPPGRVIYVEAGDEKSVLACFEEGLRGGFSAVVAEIAGLSMTASRRLHLAAESSGAIGIAIRRWRRRVSDDRTAADRRRQPDSGRAPSCDGFRVTLDSLRSSGSGRQGWTAAPHSHSPPRAGVDPRLHRS